MWGTEGVEGTGQGDTGRAQVGHTPMSSMTAPLGDSSVAIKYPISTHRSAKTFLHHCTLSPWVAGGGPGQFNCWPLYPQQAETVGCVRGMGGLQNPQEAEAQPHHSNLEPLPCLNETPTKRCKTQHSQFFLDASSKRQMAPPSHVQRYLQLPASHS